MTDLPSPCYVIDEARLKANMARIRALTEASGAKALLALKCFATWSAFPWMQEALDGTTSSSLYELRLGRETFGGETHAYSVAWADHEIAEAVGYADKIIFNSLSQLERFAGAAAAIPRGLRLNPGISCSGFDLADPSRPFSRLGESEPARLETALPLISGVMIHNNCENADFDRLSAQLDRIEREFGGFLQRLDWVSLGGGIAFTNEGYPLQALAARLRAFAERFGVQVYLEPGEAAITGVGTLEVTVLDLIERGGRQIAIVDSSTEAHMLDLLIYRQEAKLPQDGPHAYQVAGKTCLAGDIFGEARLARPLAVGDRIAIADAAGYTMVKKNWFNGVAMPAIALRAADGTTRVVRQFGYDDYRASLS